MAQTTEFIGTLKAALKSRGLTYGDVAGALELSEASIERLFSEQSFSLQPLYTFRLVPLLALLPMPGTPISELAREQGTLADLAARIQRSVLIVMAR